MVLKAFLLLQGLMLAARCNVEEDQLKHRSHHHHHHHQDDWDHGGPQRHFGTDHHSAGAEKEGSDVSGTVPDPHEHVGPSNRHPSEDPSGDEEGGSTGTHNGITPARMGNWCAFVHKSVNTKPMACGTEKYIIKSQSPCPNGTPDCHLVMYKVSTRMVYREKQTIQTALLWRCCPGHGGNNCEDIVENGQVSESEISNSDIRLHPGGPVVNHTGPDELNHNQNQEQNDHHESRRLLSADLRAEKNHTEEKDNHDSTPSSSTDQEPRNENGAPSSVDNGHRGPQETHYTNPGLVPIHYLKDVMMSHLQPIFDSFNLTLARLSEEVKDLQKDMTQMQVLLMVQGESSTVGGGISAASDHEAMTDNLQQLEELNMQLGLQRDEMEEKLHAQQAMLNYNMTNLKLDMDVQNKRNQKMLQTGLHSINSTLSGLREKQEQLEERVLTLVSQISSRGRQPQEDTAVWEAITRLDNKVVNNTVRLNTFNEDQVQVSERMEHLQKHYKTLEDQITQNDRKNEDRYIEAFLEVDAAKVAVGKYADDLSKNVTTLQTTVNELEEDTNYLYTEFHRNISSGSRDCDCTGLSTSVAQLKWAIENTSVIANENRVALDNAAEERLSIWENGGWGPPVEEIKLSLHTVQDLLALEQEKRKTQQQNLNTFEKALSGIQLDIKALQEQDSQKAGKLQYLSNTFKSLLQDALRHTHVLEFLLGEGVWEFIDRSEQEKKGYSILTLKMLISDLQEQINRHSRSLASMLNSEDPTADEPQMADWIAQDLKRIQNEQKFVSFSDEPTDYTDKDFFASLEKTVEELQAQVTKLREQQCLSCCNCTKGAYSKDVEGKLHAELTSVRKSLDNHLRIFSSVFSNTEGLTESEATVDLDKLHGFMKKKEAKHQRKRQKKISETRDASRSKRHTSLKMTVYTQLPESPLMFVASNRDGVNTPGKVMFETAPLNHGRMYSPETGSFRAPVAGVYLFVLTLDFGPGPSLAQLKRGEEVAASLHQNMRSSWGPATRVCLLELHQGEEIQLELVQGTLKHGKPQDNTFAGLLLLQHT